MCDLKIVKYQNIMVKDACETRLSLHLQKRKYCIKYGGFYDKKLGMRLVSCHGGNFNSIWKCKYDDQVLKCTDYKFRGEKIPIEIIYYGSCIPYMTNKGPTEHMVMTQFNDKLSELADTDNTVTYAMYFKKNQLTPPQDFVSMVDTL